MGHPQKTTPIATDNATADDFFNNNIVMKKSKSWDMYLHWLWDKEAQEFSKYAAKKD